MDKITKIPTEHQKFIKDMHALSLSEDDVVIVRIPDGHEVNEGLFEALGWAFPSHRVLVLEGEVKVGVVSNAGGVEQ